MSGTKIAVSDHALIRYMERVYGLDFEKVREEMLPLDLKIAIATCGDGRYPMPGGHVAVVKSETVVTVLSEEE